MVAHDIIIKPIITEKSMEGIANKKYTFRVALGANKIQIANALPVRRTCYGSIQSIDLHIPAI